MNEQQPIFDQLLAKGIKLIHADGAAEKIAATVAKGDPVIGIKTMTEAVLQKIEDGAAAANKKVPLNMMPDLALAFASQIAEISKAAGNEVTDETITTAFQGVIEEGARKRIDNKSVTKEEMADALEKLKAKQGIAGSEQSPNQPVQPLSPVVNPNMPLPAQAQPTAPAGMPTGKPRTMTEKLEGGLL